MSSQIALMIDADNVSYRYMDDIIQHISRHGELVIKAAYGNWQDSGVGSWQYPIQKHGLKVRQSGSKASNSTDMQLIIDSMDILRYRSEIDTFCIVSNDADYVPLCRKLRKSKKHIIGMGYRLASTELIRACDQFIFIGPKPVTKPLSINTGSQSKPSARIPQASKLPALRKLVEAAMHQLPSGWVKLSALGSALRQIQSGFQNKHYGYKSLSQLLESMPDVVEIQVQGTVKYVRLAGENSHDDLRQLVLSAFGQVPQARGKWVRLSALGEAFREVRPNFQSSLYGYPSLSKLLDSMPDLVEMQKQGTISMARLRK